MKDEIDKGAMWGCFLLAAFFALFVFGMWNTARKLPSQPHVSSSREWAGPGDSRHFKPGGMGMHGWKYGGLVKKD